MDIQAQNAARASSSAVAWPSTSEGRSTGSRSRPAPVRLRPRLIGPAIPVTKYQQFFSSLRSRNRLFVGGIWAPSVDQGGPKKGIATPKAELDLGKKRLKDAQKDHDAREGENEKGRG